MSTDYRMIDGEAYLSERGIVLMAYVAWKDEHTEPGKRFMDGYCELLYGRGYGSSGYLNFLELSMIKDTRAGVEWVKKTFEHLQKMDIVQLAKRTFDQQ